MMLKTVPGQTTTVVEAHFHGLAEIVHQCTCQQGILERNFAFRTGTNDMDRTWIVVKLFAHGAIVDKRRQDDAFGFGSTQKSARAVAGGQYQRVAVTQLGGVFVWRVPDVEAGQRYSPAFAAEQDPAGAHLAR